MNRLVRLIGVSMVALTLALGGVPDTLAKKKSSSVKKSAKSKSSKGGKKASARSAKKGRSSRNRNNTVARQQSNPDRQSDSRGDDSDAQGDNLPPTPRAVASGIPQDRVMEIQSALSKAGYYTGEVNGIYDESTRQAMKQYQEAHSLNATGLPSAHSLKKLGVSKRSNATYATPIKKASDGNTPE